MAPSGNQPLNANASSFNPTASSSNSSTTTSLNPTTTPFVPAPSPGTWYSFQLPTVLYADKTRRPVGRESFNLYLLTPTTATIRYLPSETEVAAFQPKTTFTTTIAAYRDDEGVRSHLLTTLLQGQVEWTTEIDYPFCLTVTHFRSVANAKDDTDFDWLFRLIRNQLYDCETGRTPDWLAETLATDDKVTTPLDFGKLKFWMRMERPAIARSLPVAGPVETRYAFFDVWYFVDASRAGIHARTAVSVVTETRDLFPYPSMRDPNAPRTKEGERISHPSQHHFGTEQTDTQEVVVLSPDVPKEQIEAWVREKNEELLVRLDRKAEESRRSWDWCVRFIADSRRFPDPGETALKWQEAWKRVVPRERAVTDEMIVRREMVKSWPKESPRSGLPVDSGYAGRPAETEKDGEIPYLSLAQETANEDGPVDDAPECIITTPPPQPQAVQDADDELYRAPTSLPAHLLRRERLYTLLNFDRQTAGQPPLNPHKGYRPPPRTVDARHWLWSPQLKTYVPETYENWFVLPEEKIAIDELRKQGLGRKEAEKTAKAALGKAKRVEEMERIEAEAACAMQTRRGGELPAWLRNEGESREVRRERRRVAGERRGMEVALWRVVRWVEARRGEEERRKREVGAAGGGRARKGEK